MMPVLCFCSEYKQNLLQQTGHLHRFRVSFEVLYSIIGLMVKVAKQKRGRVLTLN